MILKNGTKIFKNGNYINSVIDWDIDAVAYLNATGVPNNNTILYVGTRYERTGRFIWYVVNNFVKNLKGYGLINNQYNLWNKLVAVYPFIGGTATAHKFNLKNPLDTNAAFRLTYVNTLSHSGAGLVGSASGYALTNLYPLINLSLNDVHICNIISNITPTWGFSYEMGIFANGTGDGLYKRSTEGSNTDNAINSNFNTNFATSGRSTILYRSSSTVQKHCKDGTVSSSNITSIALANINFPLMGLYNRNTSNYTNFSANSHSYDSIGFGFTDAEATMYHNCIVNLQTLLNRYNP